MTDTEALIAELRAYTGDLVFGKNDADRLIDRAADALEGARSRVGVLEAALREIEREDYDPAPTEFGGSFTLAAANIARTALDTSNAD